MTLQTNVLKLQRRNKHSIYYDTAPNRNPCAIASAPHAAPEPVKHLNTIPQSKTKIISRRDDAEDEDQEIPKIDRSSSIKPSFRKAFSSLDEVAVQYSILFVGIRLKNIGIDNNGNHIFNIYASENDDSALFVRTGITLGDAAKIWRRRSKMAYSKFIKNLRVVLIQEYAELSSISAEIPESPISKEEKLFLIDRAVSLDTAE